jgi:hypothetical protein
MRDSLQASFARIRSGRPPGQSIRDNYWEAELARNVPGRFAGLYLGSPASPYIGAIEGERRLVVLLVDTTDVAGSLAALEAHVGPVMRMSEGRLGDAVVRKARWDFAQLLEWQHFLVQVVREVVGRRGFGSAVSVVRNRVTFALPDSTALRRVAARLATMDLPCDLLHLEIGGRLAPAGGQASTPDHAAWLRR